MATGCRTLDIGRVRRPLNGGDYLVDRKPVTSVFPSTPTSSLARHGSRPRWLRAAARCLLALVATGETNRDPGGERAAGDDEHHPSHKRMMADGERHDEFGEKREPQRDLAVEDQLEVCVLADQQPVDQKAAQRLCAAKDKPGSSNPLTSVGGRSGNRVFFKTVPPCPAPAIAFRRPAQAVPWAGVIRLGFHARAASWRFLFAR
jgi:hypothetical protein